MNYRIPQLLIVASIWYLIVTTILSIGQYYLERHYARGTRELQPTTLGSLVGERHATSGRSRAAAR